jgi:hypothetical protein
MHGGAMRIRSILGKGTTVVVRLPLIAKPIMREEPNVVSPPLADCEAALV